MPPQSRGIDKNYERLTRPILQSFPTQQSRRSRLTPGQTTPTDPGSQASDDDHPTPVRARPLAVSKNESTDDVVNNDDDDDGDGKDNNTDNNGDDDGRDSLNDDEFESHYSRQESPVSSSDDDDDNDQEDTEDDVVEMSPTRSRVSELGGMIQRVSSLPANVPYHNHTSQLHMSHSTTSLPRAAPPIPPPLYPPFYNRPPTPLPPSPSLTSLLRPPSLLNRSTTSTRPTTPDSSDIETPATNDDTEAAVASSARRAHPLPPTSPKVPTYEYYGFVLYLASTLFFFLYILWAYLPSPFLHALGITYYPNRWWALAVPAWIVMLLVYIYVALACWNVEYLTLGFHSVETMVDEAGNVAILDPQGRVRKGGSKRFEAEMFEKQRRENTNGSWTKKKGGTGYQNGGMKKKDRRRKDRERDKEREWRFGYSGEVFHGKVASGLAWSQIWNEGTDAVMDVPIGGVCEVLYGQGEEF